MLTEATIDWINTTDVHSRSAWATKYATLLLGEAYETQREIERLRKRVVTLEADVFRLNGKMPQEE